MAKKSGWIVVRHFFGDDKMQYFPGDFYDGEHIDELLSFGSIKQLGESDEKPKKLKKEIDEVLG